MGIYKDQNSIYRAQDVGNWSDLTIGGNRSGGKFVPNLNCSWRCGQVSEQFYLNINRAGGIVNSEVESFSNGKVSLALGAVTDEFLLNGPDESKWNIVYASDPRPTPHVGDYQEKFNLKFSQGVSFYYQPELTAQEIAEGHSRPDRVIGSYAVYCDKANNGYKTGKLGHIYRPWIMDALGNGIWGTLDISGSVLTATIPASFLDSAVFPVTLDPNLGYTTIGASNAGYGTSFYLSSHDTTDGSGGTTSDIYFYVASNFGTTHGKFAIYNSGGSRPSTKIAAEVEATVTSASSWQSVVYAVSLSASTKYWVAWIGDSGNLKLAYDAADAARQNYSGAAGYSLPATWPDPGTNNTTRWSLYAVYTSGGGSTISPSAGSVVYTGQTSTLSTLFEPTIRPGAGSLAYVGQQPSLATWNYIAATLAPATGTLTYTGNQAAIALWDFVATTNAPSVGSLVYSGATPVIGTGALITVGPASGTITYTGGIPALSILSSLTLSPSSGSVVYAGEQPGISATNPIETTIAVLTGSLIYSGQTPSLSTLSSCWQGVAVQSTSWSSISAQSTSWSAIGAQSTSWTNIPNRSCN